MTDCRKVFVDTAPFIYYIEKDENNPLYFEKVKKFFRECYDNGIEFVSSVITVEEYLVFPYRIQSQCYVDMFYKLMETVDMDIMEINQEIAKKAAKIRAEYKGFKGMDALQLASACLADCDLFLTNDKQLKQFRELTCITVGDLE